MSWTALTLPQIAEQLPVGLAVVDRENRIRYANRQLLRLLGATGEPGLRGERLDAYRIAPLHNAANNDCAGSETSLRGSDGREIPVREEIYPVNVTRADGCTVHFFLDLSAQEELKALRPLALHDALTGLPNRNVFDDRLSRAAVEAQRSGKGFALLYADIDSFKSINDSQGHAAGDLVLRRTGERIAAALRRSDSLARLGGDEFAAILPGTDHHAGAVSVAEKLIANCRPPHVLEHGLAWATLSIGIALYPQDAQDLPKLLKSADQALYRAKLAGRNRWALAGTARPIRSDSLAGFAAG